MRQLIDKTIKWDAIGDHPVKDYSYSVEHTVLEKKSKKLKIGIRLNFVMPFFDVKNLKTVILKGITELTDVSFEFIYDDMILSTDEIVKLYLPYMIQGVDKQYGAITKAIQINNIKLVDNEIVIYNIGQMATEELNRNVSKLFHSELIDKFHIDKQIVFCNNQKEYEKKTTTIKEEENKDIEECLRIQKEERKKQSESSMNSLPKAQNSGTPSFYLGAGGNSQSKPNTWRRKKEAPAEGNKILGNLISGEPMEIASLDAETGTVVVEGDIFKFNEITTKTGRKILSIIITDNVKTLCCKAFLSPEKCAEIQDILYCGDGVIIKGKTQIDKYENILTLDITDINRGKKKEGRKETYEGEKRVELHCHSKMSSMDGLNEPSQIINQAVSWGQKAVAITDHGVVQSFPDMANLADEIRSKSKSDFKIIYGLEGYVFDDKDLINDDGAIRYKETSTNHIIILARNQQGLSNIYKLVSISHLNYFYKRPRIPWSVLRNYREGLIIGSACEAGEVFRAVLHNNNEKEIEEIASRYDYLEIQPRINNKFMIESGIVSGNDDLEELNRKVVALADKLGKPVVATTDAHYNEPEAAIYRNILMAGQGYKDAEGGQGLYLRTTQEMLDEFSYLGEELARKVVIDNTNLIADSIEADIRPVPMGKFPPKIDNADETLRSTCYQNAHRIYGNPLPEKIQRRLDNELNSIIGNGYAVMYVSAQMLVNKSLSDGYLVGSRGSVGSSFAATMAGITEVNPLPPHYICSNCKTIEWGNEKDYDCGCDMPEKVCPKCGKVMDQNGFTIPFETFLGFEGDKEPDIDLNFAGEYQPIAHKYVGEIFGEKNVYKAGTVGTIADKTAKGFVFKYYQELGGTVDKYQEERLAGGFTGVKRTTGQHPGGIVIVPDNHEIFEFCPIQHPANDSKSDIVTTHFDYHKIDQNLLKLDILGHDVPSMIRQLQDMTGIEPHTIPFKDDKVKSIFDSCEALDIKDPNYKFVHGSYGIPEFGTKFTRQMLDDTKPDKFADLVRISGFSHGTDVWINNARDYILSKQATMREVISTRDDIMNYLILKGLPNADSFKIMEKVRKGKGVSDAYQELMRKNDVPEWYIDSCKKIKYMFPRAHAVAYVMMSWRMAWFKVYYPIEFYATYFTTKVSEFDAETILKGPKAVTDKIDLINSKGKTATTLEENQVTVLEIAYEMYSRGYEFKSASLGLSDSVKFLTHDGKVLLPFLALEGMGETAARALKSEYDKCPFETIEEIKNRAKINKSAMEALRNHGVLKGLPETDQFSFL